MTSMPLIDELAELLSESVNRMRTLREAHRFAALPGSPLVAEALKERSEDDLYGAIGLIGYEIAAAQIAAAEDHIDAMATLLTHGRSMVAPLVLARAAIEASARSSYVLDTDLADKERASCVLGERLNEFRQLRRLIVADDPQAKSLTATKDLEETDAAIDRIESFLEEHDLKKPGRPGFTPVVRRALKTSSEHESFGAVATAAYSALAHAVPDMLLAYTVDRSNPEWAPFEIGLGERRDNLLFDSVFAVHLAYAGAVKLQITAYGWSPEPWASWIDKVRRTLTKRLDELHEEEGPSSPRVSLISGENDAGPDEHPGTDEYSIPVPGFLQLMLEDQREAFIEKFGHEPGPRDPLFFDPEATEPTPYGLSDEDLLEQTIELVDNLGQLTPARDYAIRRCGFVASTYSWPSLPESRKQEWREAVSDYYQSLGAPPPDDAVDLVELSDPG